MKIIRRSILTVFFTYIMVPKIVLSAPNPKSMDFAWKVPFFSLKVRCSDLPCIGLNPNDVKIFSILLNNNNFWSKSHFFMFKIVYLALLKVVLWEKWKKTSKRSTKLYHCWIRKVSGSGSGSKKNLDSKWPEKLDMDP